MYKYKYIYIHICMYIIYVCILFVYAYIHMYICIQPIAARVVQNLEIVSAKNPRYQNSTRGIYH